MTSQLDYSFFEPIDAITELAKLLERSRNGFVTTRQYCEEDATGVLGPLNKELLQQYVPKSFTIWTNGMSATAPGSAVTKNFSRLIRRVGHDSVPAQQLAEITSTVQSFLAGKNYRNSLCPVELTVTDFSYSTEGPVKAFFGGADNYNSGTRSGKVYLTSQDSTSLRCSRYTRSQRVSLDLSRWLIAQDQKNSRFHIRDARRITHFGDLMVIRSFEERLQLDDDDEIGAWADPLRVYGYSEANPIEIGSKDIRIRCVRYLPSRWEKRIPKCNLHRLELVLVPGDYELLQVVTRFSSLRCYTVTTPGAVEAIHSAVKRLK
ncbi:MAG TPA: hypothetical protein DDW52_23180 [Planctomycetaceae bacterium]|nr:hypothetical protein [Planctomycetaceae bacterium]